MSAQLTPNTRIDQLGGADQQVVAVRDKGLTREIAERAAADVVAAVQSRSPNENLASPETQAAAIAAFVTTPHLADYNITDLDTIQRTRDEVQQRIAERMRALSTNGKGIEESPLNPNDEPFSSTSTEAGSNPSPWFNETQNVANANDQHTKRGHTFGDPNDPYGDKSRENTLSSRQLLRGL